jgi:hypothetical protein
MVFSRHLPESERTRHLVVELKRPMRLTMAEFGQINNHGPETVMRYPPWTVRSPHGSASCVGQTGRAPIPLGRPWRWGFTGRTGWSSRRQGTPGRAWRRSPRRAVAGPPCRSCHRPVSFRRLVIVSAHLHRLAQSCVWPPGRNILKSPPVQPGRPSPGRPSARAAGVHDRDRLSNGPTCRPGPSARPILCSITSAC